MTFRTRDEVAGLAAGIDLVDPGVVPVQEWRPDSPLEPGSLPTAMWGLVARTP